MGPVGIFLECFLTGRAIGEERRQAVTLELGFSETVFIDDAERGMLRIFLPTSEAAFAGHPLVGAAWLLREAVAPVAVLHPPEGTSEFATTVR
jgi:predicted PhzF superfamily epimerase YddE/YHI9